MLRTMTAMPTIREEIKKVQNVNDIKKVANEILTKDRNEMEREISKSNRSGKVSGFGFHFQPIVLLNRDTIEIGALEYLQSPILQKYAVDSNLYAGDSNSVIRFLFESRGIYTNTWGTDFVSGYQRNAITPESLAELEPPGSDLKAIVEKFQKVKNDSPKIRNQYCEELRQASWKATNKTTTSTLPSAIR